MKEQNKNGQNSVATSARIERLRNDLKLACKTQICNNEIWKIYKNRYDDICRNGIELKDQIELGNLLAKVNANRIQN